MVDMVEEVVTAEMVAGVVLEELEGMAWMGTMRTVLVVTVAVEKMEVTT